MRGSCAIVRALAGGANGNHKRPVRLKDGSLTVSEDQRQQAWVEHVAEVFRGQVVSKNDAQQDYPCNPAGLDNIPMTPTIAEKALRRLGSNKGEGEDLIPAGLLRAGGGGLAVALSSVYAEIINDMCWAVAWTGGRIVDVYKGKGDRNGKGKSGKH